MRRSNRRCDGVGAVPATKPRAGLEFLGPLLGARQRTAVEESQDEEEEELRRR
jgi:hypothetical protein